MIDFTRLRGFYLIFLPRRAVLSDDLITLTCGLVYCFRKEKLWGFCIGGQFYLTSLLLHVDWYPKYLSQIFQLGQRGMQTNFF